MKCSIWASLKTSKPSFPVSLKIVKPCSFQQTMPDAIKRIGVQFMKDPEHVKIAAKEIDN